MSILMEFRKKCGNLVDGNVIDRDYADLKIDEDLRQEAIRFSGRFRSSIRIANGLFYTDQERKEELENLRAVMLP